MNQKISNVTILVPMKSSGGVIRQKEVSFDVYKTDNDYCLRPCLNAAERQVANLPEELKFSVEDGKPVSARGAMDGNFHVIKDVFAKLQEHNQGV